MPIAPEIRNALAAYDRRTLIAPLQVRVIIGALAQHGFNARFLIHGCGHDSPFWHRLNAHGRTLFVEHDALWAEQTRRILPQAEIVTYGNLPTTVATTAGAIDLEALARVPVPSWAEQSWDVILIDGPPGGEAQHPGRALPIYWASRAANVYADIFVDDYDRPLERLYADRLLAEGRLTAALSNPRGSVMLWRLS
jgi:hypothetical protein